MSTDLDKLDDLYEDPNRQEEWAEAIRAAWPDLAAELAQRRLGVVDALAVLGTKPPPGLSCADARENPEHLDEEGNCVGCLYEFQEAVRILMETEQGVYMPWDAFVGDGDAN